MADDESTTTTEDTSVSEEVDTSTKEEPEEVESLEDIEVSPEDLLDDTDEAEAPEDETADTEPEEAEEESEEDTTSDEDKQKAFNKEMAERRILEKRQRELKQQEQQLEYVAAAEDDKDLALRQLQVDAYNNRVDANTNKLTNGYEKALKDFDILADKTPEIQAEVDAAIDAFQAMYVTTDAYGNPTEVRGDLYQFLQSKADSIGRLTGIRETRQKDSKGKEKSKTFTPPSKAPKEPKVDPDLAAFEEEAKKY